MYANYISREKIISGIIIQVLSSITYLVKIDTLNIWK